MLTILKKTKNKNINLVNAVSILKKRGYDAIIEKPKNKSMWLKLGDSKKRWQAWIQIKNWFEMTAPELTKLPHREKIENYIYDWLICKDKPLKMDIPELKYDKLWFDKVIFTGSLENKEFLRIASSTGYVWLEKTPEFKPHIQSKILDYINITFFFSIGCSAISLNHFNKLAKGDVLLIKKQFNSILYWYKAEKDDALLIKKYFNSILRVIKIGIFKQNPNGVIMELHKPKNITPQSKPCYNQDKINNSNDLESSLPISIYFILHRETLTLSALQRINEDQILPLPKDAQLNIEIFANDTILGYGELVKVNDSLGIEIHRWLD